MDWSDRMSLALVPMLGYSTGDDTREDLQLKWQYRNAQLITQKRARVEMGEWKWASEEMSARARTGKLRMLCKH